MAIIYFVLAWSILQVVDIAAGVLELPDWTLRATFAALVLFFPIAIILSWMFKITPRGLEREIDDIDSLCHPAVTPSSRSMHSTQQTLPDRRQALAVLPFKNADMTTSDDYMADGLTEEVIHSLSRFKALRVPCLGSCLPYKEIDCTAREAADRLSVDHILQGTVRRSGDSVKVSAELTDTERNMVLWSCTRDCQPDDFCTIDQDIARGVAGALKVDRLPEEVDRSGSGKPASPEAYHSYLKGRHAMQEGTGEGCRKAVTYYKDTIELDSDYPRAWSGLSLAYIWLARYGLISQERGFDLARTAALEALELDESLGEAYLAIAQVQLSRDWDFEAAESSLQKALELDPDNADVHSCYGHFLSMFGRLESAIAARERALDLDPLSEIAHYGLADTLFLAGRHDDALNLLRRIEELSSDFPVEHLKARIALEKGLPREALSIIESEKLEWRRLYISAVARSRLGERAAARELLKDLISRYSDDAMVQIAIVYAQLGEHDEAFRWLQDARDIRDPGFVELAADPELAPLRSDPRFAGLMKEANFNIDDWQTSEGV
jgi:adenylate cyclase